MRQAPVYVRLEFSHLYNMTVDLSQVITDMQDRSLRATEIVEITAILRETIVLGFANESFIRALMVDRGYQHPEIYSHTTQVGSTGDDYFHPTSVHLSFSSIVKRDIEEIKGGLETTVQGAVSVFDDFRASIMGAQPPEKYSPQIQTRRTDSGIELYLAAQ